MHATLHSPERCAARDNRTKARMASGQPALGISLTIPDAFVAEMVGAAGFDFVLVDTEHSPITVDQLQTMLVALRASSSTTFVRPVANDPGLIKQILDLGAEGVVVPEVHDAASAAAAVAATRYPPSGRRGVGPPPGFGPAAPPPPGNPPRRAERRNVQVGAGRARPNTTACVSCSPASAVDSPYSEMMTVAGS